MIRKSKFYFALGLGVLAFSITWIFLVFFQIEGNIGSPGNTPRSIPFFLGCCMFLLGVIFIYQYYLGYRPKSSIEGIKKNEIKNIAICIFFFVLYSFTLEWFGFLISTPVIIFLITRFLLQEKSWKINILFPILMTASIYFIFITLLNSALPRGTIIELL
jgi:hypothetical protein